MTNTTNKPARWIRELAKGRYGDGKPVYQYTRGHLRIERCDIDESEDFDRMRQYCIIDLRDGEEIARSLWTLKEAKAKADELEG